MTERVREVIPGFDALAWSGEAKRKHSALLLKMTSAERAAYFRDGAVPERLRAYYDEHFETGGD